MVITILLVVSAFFIIMFVEARMELSQLEIEYLILKGKIRKTEDEYATIDKA